MMIGVFLLSLEIEVALDSERRSGVMTCLGVGTTGVDTLGLDKAVAGAIGLTRVSCELLLRLIIDVRSFLNLSRSAIATG